MNKKRMLAVGILVFGAASAPCRAIDGIAVEAGSGNDTDMGRVAVQWDWKTRFFQGRDWHLGGYWDLGLGYWHRDAAAGENEQITDLGFTPVFRLQRNDLKGPYVEAAIGFHLLSKTSIGDRHLSTAFQFGDHVGLGYRFGGRGEYDLSYRFQHLSNAGIKRPNPGIGFHQIRLQYHF